MVAATYIAVFLATTGDVPAADQTSAQKAAAHGAIGMIFVQGVSWYVILLLPHLDESADIAFQGSWVECSPASNQCRDLSTTREGSWDLPVCMFPHLDELRCKQGASNYA